MAHQLSQYGQLVDDYNDAVGKAPDHALAYVNWGIKLSQEGNLSAAIEKFQTAASMDPNRAICFANWGIALAQASQLSEAIERFEHALKLEPHNADVYALLGAALVELGEWEKANTIYERATAISPQSESLFVNWGVALARSGPNNLQHYERAIEKFQIALSIRPYQPWVLFLWGVVLAEQSHYEAAIEKFKLTLRYLPKHSDAYYFWCVCLNRLGRFEEALHVARQALFLEPDNADIYLQLAEALLHSGQPESALSAIANIRHALMLNPEQADAYELLGQALLKTNEPAEAVERFEKALLLNPELKSVHAHWGRALLLLGQYEEALFHLKQAHELDPDNVEVLLQWALVSLKQDQLDVALEKLFAIEGSTARSQDAWNPRLHFLLGSHYLSEGDYDKAVKSLKIVMEADPTFIEAGIQLALAYCGLAENEGTDSSHWDEAIWALRPLLRQQPQSSRLLFYMGHCLFRKGDISAAQEKMEAALLSDPTMTEPKIALAECTLLQGNWAKAKEILAPLVKPLADSGGSKNIAAQLLSGWLCLHQATQLLQASSTENGTQEALVCLEAAALTSLAHPALVLGEGLRLALISLLKHPNETPSPPIDWPNTLHGPYRWAIAGWQQLLPLSGPQPPLVPPEADWAERYPLLVALFHSPSSHDGSPL